MNGDVLVLSQQMAGGVMRVAAAIRDIGLRPVLVSSEREDRNAHHCDKHVYINWDEAAQDEVARAIDSAEVHPVAVVNLVEPLQLWQMLIARHYRLRGAEPGREVLLSKLQVRAALQQCGVAGTVHFAGGPADDPSWIDTVDFYPAVAKPSRDSGASRLVRRVEDAAELRAHLDRIAQQDGPDTEVVVESYVDGQEFSMDGPIVDRTYRPVFVCDKAEYDYQRHHESGVLFAPPVTAAVIKAVPRLAEKISALCRCLDLDAGWLHVEGRATVDGDVELIEINARYGGGTVAPGIRRAHQFDPVTALVSMALPEGWAPPSVVMKPDAWLDHEQLGLFFIEPMDLGTVLAGADASQLLAIDGVVDAFVFDQFTASSLDVENFFAFFLLSGSVEALPKLAARVRAALPVQKVEYEIT